MRLEHKYNLLRSDGLTNYSAFGYSKSSNTVVMTKLHIKSMACRGGRVYFKDDGKVDTVDGMSDMGIYFPSIYSDTMTLFWRGRMGK